MSQSSKKCRACHLEHALDHFYKHRKVCIDCYLERQRLNRASETESRTESSGEPVLETESRTESPDSLNPPSDPLHWTESRTESSGPSALETESVVDDCMDKLNRTPPDFRTESVDAIWHDIQRLNAQNMSDLGDLYMGWFGPARMQKKNFHRLRG